MGTHSPTYLFREAVITCLSTANPRVNQKGTDMKVDRIDHLVLTVQDVEKAFEFYDQVLGMEVILLENNRKALRFGEQKINLHELGTKFALNALHPTCGSEDVCFLTSVPLPEVVDHLRACSVYIVMGPTVRSGATGPIQSVYFRDPDANIIEVANHADR